MPCSTFPITYGLIERCTFEIMLETCSKTHIPPKPSKKLAIIIFWEIALRWTKVAEFIPLVSSIIPVKILMPNFGFNPKRCNTGWRAWDNIYNILL